MNASLVKRDERGRLLAGGANLNPGGRPKSAIEEVRALLSPHAPQLVAQLVELAKSPNEATRLAAIREALDRLLGKAPIAVDQTVQKFDQTALFLEALKMAQPGAANAIDVTPTTDEIPSPDAPAGAECNDTEW